VTRKSGIQLMQTTVY